VGGGMVGVGRGRVMIWRWLWRLLVGGLR
jgi:hypothetical protein